MGIHDRAGRVTLTPGKNTSGGQRLVAVNRMGVRLEYDGVELRLTDVRLSDKKPLGTQSIPVSSIWGVESRDAGNWMQGWLHFAYPLGKRHGGYLQKWVDGTCYFWPKEANQFLAVRDAVLSLVEEGRRLTHNARAVTRSEMPAPPTSPAIPGLTTFRGLRVGELSSHFDSTTTGQITGTMHHDLIGGFSGISLDLALGIVDTALAGSIAIKGASAVDLISNSTSRVDLFSQSFVAIFDVGTDGRRETLRVIAPSEPVCRERIRLTCPGGCDARGSSGATRRGLAGGLGGRAWSYRDDACA